MLLGIKMMGEEILSNIDWLRLVQSVNNEIDNSTVNAKNAITKVWKV